jgi:hypothetical protein
MTPSAVTWASGPCGFIQIPEAALMDKVRLMHGPEARVTVNHFFNSISGYQNFSTPQ